MRIVTLVVMIAVVLMGVTFAILNAEQVQVDYYFSAISLPLSLLMVMVLGLGMLLGLLMSLLRMLRLSAENRRLKSKMRLVEKEVENLRSIPLKDEH